MIVFVFAIFLGIKPFNATKVTSGIYVIPGGESIGLQLNTGVYVTGKYKVETKKGKVTPWNQSGILIEDKIISINGKEVSAIEDLHLHLKSVKENENITLIVERQNKKLEIPMKVTVDKDGKASLGLYVKDKILGIGTITYIDEETSTYGALGHGVINEYLKNEKLGYIASSTVKGIRKAIAGTPGEKQAIIDGAQLGDIKINSNIGIFGKFYAPASFSSSQKIEVAYGNEVVLGKAEIWTVIENNRKEKFEIEIIEVMKQSQSMIKGIKYKIVDKRLLEKTGGVIQGMSGSPIIQNNKLIGAISHVVVDNPAFGYGVFAEWMIKNRDLL